MPTYDYQCQACGHEWELFQSMNDSPVKSCPSCKKRKAKRLLGLGAGIIFKGTGFYETDYKVKKGEDKKKAPRRPSLQTPAEILLLSRQTHPPHHLERKKKRQQPSPRKGRLKTSLFLRPPRFE